VSQRLPRDPWVTLIGIGKMLKTAALVAIGTTALLLVHHDAAAELRRLIAVLGIAPGGRFVRRALTEAGLLGDHQLREIAVVTFLYAALFALEGTGLLLQRRWGEWVSIVITIEIYETAHAPHVGRAVGTLVNIAAVAYLVSRVRQPRAPRGVPTKRNA